MHKGTYLIAAVLFCTAKPPSFTHLPAPQTRRKHVCPLFLLKKKNSTKKQNELFKHVKITSQWKGEPKYINSLLEN